MFEMIPNNYLPSGLYICHPTVISTISLANPYFSNDPPYSVVERESGNGCAGLEAKVRSHGDCVFLKLSDIRDYSSTVVTVSRQFKELSYDAVLCPLRGSRMPSAQVATMCEAAKDFHAFDFSYGAQGYNDDRIADDLCEIIDGVGRSGRIAVLDTAKGGYGSAKLAELLDGRVFAELGVRHETTFHLMHETTRRPEKSAQIYGYDGFGINYHPVQSLLFEDESRLLGYETLRDGESSHIHPLSSSGRVAVLGDNSIEVYEAKALDGAAIGIIGTEIGNVLDELPDVVLSDANYWQRQGMAQ